MQTQNPFLDEFAKLTTAAMGLAQAAGDEAKTAFRAQADKKRLKLGAARANAVTIDFVKTPPKQPACRNPS